MGVVSRPSQDCGSGGGARSAALGAVGVRVGVALFSAGPPSSQGPVSQVPHGLLIVIALPGFTGLAISGLQGQTVRGGQAGVRSALLLQEIDPARVSWALPGCPLASG